ANRERDAAGAFETHKLSAGHTVTLSGNVYDRGGIKGLLVQSYSVGHQANRPGQSGFDRANQPGQSGFDRDSQTNRSGAIDGTLPQDRGTPRPADADRAGSNVGTGTGTSSGAADRNPGATGAGSTDTGAGSGAGTGSNR